MTLRFATLAAASGEPVEVSGPMLLATILLAVESDRRDIRNRVAAGFEEEVEAVANLYWPFLIVRGEGALGAAVFDVTGVWKRTFRYSVMPSAEAVRPVLAAGQAPAEYLGRMGAVSKEFRQESGVEVLTVDGFLPVDPPFQAELLAESRHPSSPPAPHPGFLPARHKVEWYEEEVSRMRDWLERFEADLGVLREVRSRVEANVRAGRELLDEEYRRADEEARERSRAATEAAHEEIGQIQQAHHAEVRRHLESIRTAHRTVAQSEAAIATAGTLAERAVGRRADARPHEARAREARQAIRRARAEVRQRRRAIEQVHEQQRFAQEAALARVTELDRTDAQALSRLELFRDHFLSAGDELLRAIDDQVSARSRQREVLAGYFLPPSEVPAAKVVWLPLWVATLRSPRGARQVVFPPLKARETVGVGGALKRLFGGVVLPLEPRTVPFDRGFRVAIEQALAADPWIARVVQELTRAADVLADPDVLDRFEEGLSEIRGNRWISPKQATDYLRTYREVLRKRSAHPPATDAPNLPSEGVAPPGAEGGAKVPRTPPVA